MEKLELKHIVGYLPYGVKAKYTDTFRDEVVGIIDGFEKYRGFCIDGCFDKSMQPILRPLSDLTKEIEHNGERFVPIEKLQEIYNKRLRFDEDGFYYHVDQSCVRKGGDEAFPFNQLEAYQYLYKWHFDLHNLIDNNLAISINFSKTTNY